MLYRLVAPSIALLCIFGLGRAAVLRLFLPQMAAWQWPSLPTAALPQVAWPEFSLPQLSLPQVEVPTIALPSFRSSDGEDCRQAVLERADRFEQTQGKPANWSEVDQRFRAENPGFTAAIDPENPDHKPYIQSWCGIANQWFDETS
ncbi:MAG: hypothetical protein HC824_11000 [Synechococcales cyanobacterium RM1_1_8]|nr:hypothetical protein [Synechococcales cyanobacterium RM1_1_8]